MAPHRRLPARLPARQIPAHAGPVHQPASRAVPATEPPGGTVPLPAAPPPPATALAAATDTAPARSVVAPPDTAPARSVVAPPDTAPARSVATGGERAWQGLFGRLSRVSSVLLAALPGVVAVPGAATGSSGTGIDFQPTTSALPGGDTLRQLTDGIGGWALIAALVGLVIGAATWALGAHSNNYQHTVTGRRAVLVSAVAALLIGAAPTLINFMFATGQSAK